MQIRNKLGAGLVIVGLAGLSLACGGSGGSEAGSDDWRSTMMTNSQGVHSSVLGYPGPLEDEAAVEAYAQEFCDDSTIESAEALKAQAPEGDVQELINSAAPQGVQELQGDGVTRDVAIEDLKAHNAAAEWACPDVYSDVSEILGKPLNEMVLTALENAWPEAE